MAVSIEISISTTEQASLPQLRIAILSWEPAPLRIDDKC